jgi:hypothetical protein
MQMRYFAVLIVGCVIVVAGFLTLFYTASQQSSTENRLKNSVTEFLKTTDVSKFLMDGSVTVKAVYDNKYGGEIVVAEYRTISMGHPTFMLEALENHVAVITFDASGKVVSAFCVHGVGVFWDLVNQKWFPAGKN